MSVPQETRIHLITQLTRARTYLREMELLRLQSDYPEMWLERIARIKAQLVSLETALYA